VTISFYIYVLQAQLLVLREGGGCWSLGDFCRNLLSRCFSPWRHVRDKRLLVGHKSMEYLEISPITTGPWRLMDMLEKMQTWRQHIHD